MKIAHWNISKASHPVYALKKYEDELFDGLNAIAGGRHSLVRMRRPEGDIRGNTVFSWLFYKSHDADIVHATSQTLAPALYFKKIDKFVVTVHDLAPLVYPSEINDLSMRLQYSLTPGALLRADKIIADSHFTRDELLRLTDLGEDRIEVVHLGVDHDLYRPMERSSCKESFGLDPEEKHILVVSSNLEHKRMDLAKRIFEDIRSEREDVKMIKAGYGQALEGEGIISLGWIPEEEMPHLFNASDAYLHTSEYEGFGLPILEAMACGVPVVASKSASIPEVVGDAGFLFDSKKLDLARVSEEISRKIDGGMDEASIRRSREFSWARTARKTMEVYETMFSY